LSGVREAFAKRGKTLRLVIKEICSTSSLKLNSLILVPFVSGFAFNRRVQVPLINKQRMKLHNPLSENLQITCDKATSILDHFVKGTNDLDQKLIPTSVLKQASGY
jgi:hypothetical protein